MLPTSLDMLLLQDKCVTTTPNIYLLYNNIFAKTVLKQNDCVLTRNKSIYYMYRTTGQIILVDSEEDILKFKNDHEP